MSYHIENDKIIIYITVLSKKIKLVLIIVTLILKLKSASPIIDSETNRFESQDNLCIETIYMYGKPFNLYLGKQYCYPFKD